MKILVIGSGGREHCLVWKIAQSSRVKQIFCAPGNGGTAGLAKNIPISSEDIQTLADFARQEMIDLTVVGPEQPLVAGIVDQFQKRGLKIFGPQKQLALLEGSKVFAKETMARLSLPTAGFRVFSSRDEALAYIRQKDGPVVVKADGLASGKGVFVCRGREEALKALKIIMIDKAFGDAGASVVIEDCLEGQEVSCLVFSDGNRFCPLASAQDHKRAYDGDVGPNTGGMGAYSPASVVSAGINQQVEKEIWQPLFGGLNKENKKYTGILYAGLMITKDGPKVLEFNVRFGDPETQAVLPRMKTDLVEVMLASIEGNLERVNVQWDTRPCICVVLVSEGYPGHYETGKEISGLAQASLIPNTLVFHAATKKEGRKYFSCGGRVLNVAALGDSLLEARDNAYQAVEEIYFEQMYFRRDIGWRALAH